MDQKEPSESRRVIEAEIVNPEEKNSNTNSYNGRFGNSGYYSGVWTFPAVSRDGCLAPAITLGIFFFCLGGYGLLAAIGFAVFYAICYICGIVYTGRKLMLGQPVASIWTLRCISWLISFLLTIWLAGGLND